jgi:hypothetical protein
MSRDVMKRALMYFVYALAAVIWLAILSPWFW